MLQRSKFATGLAFLVLSLLTSDTVFSQAIPRANPAPHSSLRQAKLVSQRTGWAVVDQPSDQFSEDSEGTTSQHLYWTDDDGQTWREITPNPMMTRNLGNIFFLDGTHGWVLASDALGEEEGARFYLYSTEDGGRNWSSLLLQRKMFNLRDDYTFPSQVFFSDPKHGWILWHWHMMNSSLDSLLATSDGGRTWKRLPDPPGAGPLDFTSARDGWMIGGSPGQEGIPVVEDDQLWVTHDGGVHWKAISVPLPADSPANVRFSELKFNSRGNGVVGAQAPVSDYVERFFSCVARGGGKSWQVSQFEAYGASPSLVDMHVIWTVFHMPKTKGTIFDRTRTPNTIRIGDREIAPTVPDTLSLEGSLGAVDFSDDSHGWTTFFNGRPSQYGLPGSAFASSELLSTTDGGKTFQTIAPPAAEEHPVAPPELYVLNGSIVQYPALPPLALRPPPILPNGRGQIRFAPPAGGPTIIKGTGFQRENTVWIGSHQIQVTSSDGKNLQFLIPLDIAPGTYKIYVENSHGKTIETQISIRSPESLAISNVNNGQTIHPGQEILLTGSGLLIENQVWFGKQAVPATLIISGGPMLQVLVPTSIPLGPCEVYFSNDMGNSNVVRVAID
ncbi:MAG TPA: hypothetical protein VNZ03_30660 [Terriglobales bacterium]|jgi:hypothetical protein|nr:hypothetical protein [Terriglobales bacterium]